jgi:hypothetical protein
MPRDERLIEALVLGFLAKHARGRERPVTQGRIAAHLRSLGVNVDTRAVRDAMAAVSLRGEPVGTSSGGGCFLCMDRPDFLLAYRNLYGRLRTQAKRCDRFKETARAALSGQRTFDFAEAESALAQLEGAPLLPAAALGAGGSERQVSGPGAGSFGEDEEELKPAGSVGSE